MSQKKRSQMQESLQRKKEFVKPFLLEQINDDDDDSIDVINVKKL